MLWYGGMPLHYKSRACTAMGAPLSRMQWKMVPMGAISCNAAFHHMTCNLLRALRDCTDPFGNDFIIACGIDDMSDDALIKHRNKDSRWVLKVLDAQQIVCKPRSASLLVNEVEFTEHMVGNGQSRPMPGKLAAVNHWERRTTITLLRSFIGRCNHYSGYIAMYAEFSGPLHKMLQIGKVDGRKGSKKRLALPAEGKEAF